MKKQINPTIKAHLIRSAFYVLLLLAVCVIPFALAQSRSRGTTKRSAANASGAQSVDESLLPYDTRPRSPVSPIGVCSPAPWQLAADMPVDLYGAAGASDGTFFYAAGGYSFSQAVTLAVFNRYDPVANSWTPLPDMPQAATMAVAVYYPPTNKIYVFGGEDVDTGTNYNITRIYDIAGNSWTTGANMPDVHSFMAGGYVPDTGMIYILSGYNTGTVDSAQPNTWQYDPATDTWTDLTGSAPYPHPAGGFAYGVINGKLYTAGGRDATNTVINDTWEYDPVANAYTQKTDEPGTFQNNVPGSGSAQGVLWVFGGGNPFAAGPEASAGIAAPTSARVAKTSSLLSFVKRIFAPKAPDTASDGRFYNPATDTWSDSPDMNELRSFPVSGAIGDSLIIAAGGFDGAATVATTETESVCAGGGTPTPTPSATSTATPSCTPIVVDGVIDTSDPTQTDRLFRDGIPSTCAVPRVCPGVFGDGLPRHYDSYTLTNNIGATQCVTIDADAMTCVGANFILLQAYLGSFDPSNLCTNYLADIGGSPNPTGSFSFNVDNGQTVVIVVNELDPDAGCVGYSFTVSGIPCGGASPTPTPTVTPTPTPSATASARPTPTPRPRPTPHPRP